MAERSAMRPRNSRNSTSTEVRARIPHPPRRPTWAGPTSEPVTSARRVNAAPSGATARAAASARAWRKTREKKLAPPRQPYENIAIHAAGTWMNMIRTVVPLLVVFRRREAEPEAGDDQKHGGRPTEWSGPTREGHEPVWIGQRRQHGAELKAWAAGGKPPRPGFDGQPRVTPGAGRRAPWRDHHRLRRDDAFRRAHRRRPGLHRPPRPIIMGRGCRRRVAEASESWA